nr:MAG TPA: hypothetical protein [Caudoviricetes sp.]
MSRTHGVRFFFFCLYSAVSEWGGSQQGFNKPNKVNEYL